MISKKLSINKSKCRIIMVVGENLEDDKFFTIKNI